MKTSKRLLSILLMLTMLVSMFTVMASASAEEETQKYNITFKVEGEGGKIELKNTSGVTVREITNIWTVSVEPKDYFLYTVAAVADKGFTGKLYYADYDVTPSTKISELTKDITFKAVFTKDQTEEPEQPEQPETPKPASFNLKFEIKTNDVPGASVLLSKTALKNGAEITIWDDMLADGITFDTKADANYTVSWKLNGQTSNDYCFQLPKTLKAGKDQNGNEISYTLQVEFKAKEDPKPPVQDKYTLTINASEGGTVSCDGADCTNKTLSGIETKDTRVLTAKAKDGYKFVEWKKISGDAKLSTTTEETTTVTVSNVKANTVVKAFFEKEDTKTRKLYVDVTGWSRGDIDFKFYDGKDWKSWDDFTSSDSPIKLKKGQKVRFELDADSGYVAKWAIDKDAKSFKTDFTVTYDEIKNGSTLYVSFVKKSSSDVDDYPTLTFDITGAKHGTVYRGTREYEHGDVISIKKNDKMTFKAKADKGYVAVWTYKGDTYVGDEYTVKMGSTDAKLYVEFMDKDDIRLTELPFRDVSKRDWYYDDVVYVYRKGYMDGMSSTRFGGELNTTRGQIVTILWRLTGEPRATRNNPFSDVSSRQYYYDAISWAYDAGVVDGFDAHTFKPDQNVTREQLAAILYRYAEYMNLSTSGSAYLAKYRDADKIASWAYDAMAWANYHALINGTSATRIDPKGYATRAQIAAILHRFAVEFGA